MMNSVSSLSVCFSGSERASQIASLHKKLFNLPWRQDFLEALLCKTSNLSFVALTENKNEVVGFLLGSFVADEAEILSLGVNQKFQRLGVASKLLSAFLQNLKDNQAKRVFLEAGIDNNPAERLYKKYGFEVVGRRKNYYETYKGSNVDAVIMSLSL